ncbi:TonB-dependent receptor, partial [Acidobacteriota bacterium]
THNRSCRLFADPLDPDESPMTVFEFSSDTSARMTSLDWQHDLTPASGRRGRVVAGVEIRKESGDSFDPDSGFVSFDESYTVGSFYAHGQLKSPEGILAARDLLVMNLGFRLDHYEQFGNQANPKLSLVYRLPQRGIKLHAAYGTGFKAPSISDIALPFWGNPDIKPEESRSWEVGIAKSFKEKKVDLELVYFNNRFTNLIAADPVLYIASNIASARSEGMEVQLRAHPVDSLWFLASYTYLNSEDKLTGLELLRRPKHKGGFTVNVIPLTGLSLNIDGTVRGKMRDFDVAGLPPDNEGYFKLDLHAAYRLQKKAHGVSMFARIENLLNADFMEIQGYPAPGFNIHGGMRLSF